MAREMQTREHRTVDTLLELDAGTTPITASGVGDGGILDIGEGLVTADVILTVSALTTGGASEETYVVAMEYSNSATFASGIMEGPSIPLGVGAGTNGDLDPGVGRFVLPTRNEFNGTKFRYARLYATVGGTAPSITAMAQLAKRTP